MFTVASSQTFTEYSWNFYFFHTELYDPIRSVLLNLLQLALSCANKKKCGSTEETIRLVVDIYVSPDVLYSSAPNPREPTVINCSQGSV